MIIFTKNEGEYSCSKNEKCFPRLTAMLMGPGPAHLMESNLTVTQIQSEFWIVPTANNRRSLIFSALDITHQTWPPLMNLEVRQAYSTITRVRPGPRRSEFINRITAVRTHPLHIRRMLASGPSGSSLPIGPVKTHCYETLILSVPSRLFFPPSKLRNPNLLLSNPNLSLSLSDSNEEYSIFQGGILYGFVSLSLNPWKIFSFSAWFRPQSLYFIYCSGETRWISRYHLQISRSSAGNSTDRSHLCPIYRFDQSRQCILQIFLFSWNQASEIKFCWIICILRCDDFWGFL